MVCGQGVEQTFLGNGEDDSIQLSHIPKITLMKVQKITLSA